MRYGSICSGIEAATVAWHGLGWEPAFFSEIDNFPRAVLQHHYPDVPLHGDFTTINGDEYGHIDLLVGGTPCQDFSIAGLRAGLAGERGNLTLEFARLVDRMRPQWIVWENVPGVLSIDGGRAFGSFLGALAEIGYGFAYRILDAQYFGVPQRRRRVFVVGYFGDWRRAAAVLFERESLLGNPAPRREAGKGVAPILEAGARTGKSTTDVRAGSGIGNPGDPMFTLQAGKQHAVAGTIGARTGLSCGADDAANGHMIVANNSSPLTSNPYGDHESREGLLVTHTLKGEGFDASEDGTGRGTPLVPVAFSIMPVPFDTTQITSKANYSKPKAGDPCHPLAAGAHPPAIAFSIMPMNSGKDYKARETDIAQPIMAGGPVGGNQGGDFIVEPVPFDTTQITSAANYSKPKAGDPCHPLAAGAHPPAVAYGIRSDAMREGAAKTPSADAEGRVRLRDPGLGITAELCPTIDTGAAHAVAFDLRGKEGGAQFEGPHDPANIRAASGGSSRSYVAATAVRRLTPRECERLQGFPDDYTLVPYRNKPASDGPRYKALGNSMAVPCMRWIGERIELIETLTKRIV
jgi:DNA (cytosine-5)-methyltransferase 1